MIGRDIGKETVEKRRMHLNEEVPNGRKIRIKAIGVLKKILLNG